MRIALFVSWFAVLSALAAEPVTRFYMVGVADPEELIERAKVVTSPTAKVWLNPQRTQLFVTDTLECQRSVAVLLQSLQRPPRPITLRVRYPDFVRVPAQDATAGVTAGDRTGLTGMRGNPFGSAKIRFNDPPPPMADPNQPRGPQAAPLPGNVTTVTVLSGKGTWLMVSPQPPYAAWLFKWGVQRACWPATPAWTQMKTHLYAEPRLRDDTIRLRLIPTLSHAVGNAPHMAALAPLAAEATLAAGEETEVTGLIKEDEEFCRRFFTSPDANRQPQEIRIWITATMQ
ncbi:MAG: hypothetical protein HZA91_11440 [Verrucomicrobia bacterium]|nr:hypothetical protein [Verrucomicrobiota bacterium]